MRICSLRFTLFRGRPIFDRRRSLLVRGFQSRYVTAQVLCTIGLLTCFALALFAPVIVALLWGDDRQRLEAATLLLAFHVRLWPALAGLALALVCVTVTLSHRVAGPLFRFRAVFEAVARGELWSSTGIRRKDYPQEEAAALGHMVATLRDRCRALRSAHHEAAAALVWLKASGAPPASLAALDTALRRSADVLDWYQIEPPATPAATTESQAPADHPERLAGFTLIELLLITAVIGVLAAVAAPGYLAALEQARVTRAIGDIQAMDRDLQSTFVLKGCYPSTLADAGFAVSRDPWGRPYHYHVLDTAPGGAGGGKSGAGAAGSCAACNGGCVGRGQARKNRNLVPVNSDFDLFSVGRDGSSAPALTAASSEDDVVRASDGGFVGLGRNY